MLSPPIFNKIGPDIIYPFISNMIKYVLGLLYFVWKPAFHHLPSTVIIAGDSKIQLCQRKNMIGKSLLRLMLVFCFVAAASMAQQPAAPTPLKIGDPAPDFTLSSHNGKQVKLSEFKGKKNVVLAFY